MSFRPLSVRQFRIVLGIATILAILAFESPLNIAFSERVRSVFWHLRSRGNVIFQAHVFILPLAWRPGVETADKLELWRGLFNGGHQLLMIESTGSIINSDDAAAWQQRRLSILNGNLNSGGAYVAETVQSNSLRFVCIHEVQLNVSATLFCRVPDTNWHVSLVGNRAALDDSLMLLKNTR